MYNNTLFSRNNTVSKCRSIEKRKTVFIRDSNVHRVVSARGRRETTRAVSRDSIFERTLMSATLRCSDRRVASFVHNKTFSMTTLETAEHVLALRALGVSVSAKFYIARARAGRSSSRLRKIPEKFCGRIQCIGQIYCARATNVDTVCEFVLATSHRSTSLKRLKLPLYRVHSREFSPRQSSSPIL